MNKDYYILFLLSILLLKEPFVFGHLIGSYYPFLYFFVFISVIILWFIINNISICSNAKFYTLIVFFSIFSAMVISIINDSMTVSNVVRFFISIITFFIVYYLVKIMERPFLILGVLGRVSVVFSSLSLLTLFIIYFKIDFLPIITMRVPSYNSNVMILFPLSIIRNEISVGLLNYRSYSFFTEPAAFAFFITPFIYYYFSLYKIVNKLRFLFYSFINFCAMITTLSIAGYGAFCIFILIFMFALRLSRNWILFVNLFFLFLLMVLIFSLFIFDFDSNLYARRLMAINNRLLEWGTFFDFLYFNPWGVGLGNSFPNVQVFDSVMGGFREISSTVNILKWVQFFGWTYIWVLYIHLIFIGLLVFQLFYKRHEPDCMFMFIFIAISSIFFVSMNYIYSNLFQLYLVLGMLAVSQSTSRSKGCK